MGDEGLEEAGQLSQSFLPTVLAIRPTHRFFLALRAEANVLCKSIAAVWGMPGEHRLSAVSAGPAH